MTAHDVRRRAGRAAPPTPPVVLFVYARPERLARVLPALVAARPPKVLVAADVPAAGQAGDECAAARQLVRDAGWDCPVEWDVAGDHLGCDRRLVSGLDWAFAQCDRLVVVEDDVVLEPSFFPWAADVLERYADDERVAQITARNDLGRWPAGEPPTRDHFLCPLTSPWGWAGWARAWNRLDRSLLHPSSAPRHLVRAALTEPDPLVREQLGLLERTWANGLALAWDAAWRLSVAAAGGRVVVPPVNLATNIGFHSGATRTTIDHDLRGLVPSAPLPAGLDPSPRDDVDHGYARASVLLELMSSYRNPHAARRLSRFGAGVVEATTRLHLAPFDHPHEARAVLDHLVAQGCTSAVLAAVRAELATCTEAAV